MKTNALKELLKDTKARSTHGSDDSRLATMEGWLKRWGLQMYPPTIASYKAIAATLKAGGYKSAAVYLQVYRVSAERLGYATSSLDARHLKDFKKSCLRGLGGVRHALDPCRSSLLVLSRVRGHRGVLMDL